MTNSSHFFLAFVCIACGGSTNGGGFVDGGVGGNGASGGSGGAGAFGGSGGSGAFGGSGGALGGSGGVSTGGVGGCPPIAPAQQLGKFRLAISATLAPTKPILYAMDMSTQDAFGGGALVRLLGQPLDSSDRVTPVGPSIELVSLPTDGTSLHFQPTEVEIPGAANPITGSDITATVALDGQICGLASFYCGDVSGNITKPIALDLTGSHFTLETTSTPEIHVDCNMTVADPPTP